MTLSMRQPSSAPEPETECRQLDVSPVANFRAKGSISFRRKRLKLRRIKSSSPMKAEHAVGTSCEIVSGEGKCTEKRKRSDDSSKTEGFSTSKKVVSILSLPQSSGVDVILAETSSYISGSEEEKDGDRFTRCSHGSVSVIGRRRDMEDAVAIQLGFLYRGLKRYDFFGVYDGHGGARVAHACRERLHCIVRRQVEDQLAADDGVIDWEKVMLSSFKNMDEEVMSKNGSAVAMMGSTAVVAVVGEEELVVANCGDSRAVLSRDGVAVALSDDHKPDRSDELKRIEDCGGKVINWNGHRVLGVLATSRSIGDEYLKPYVISEPEVKVVKTSEKDEFVIVGCDGLWDVISNEIACQIVRRCLHHGHQLKLMGRKSCPEMMKDAESGGAARAAAAVLAELAIARGSRDNISVIVIELNRFERAHLM